MKQKTADSSIYLLCVTREQQNDEQQSYGESKCEMHKIGLLRRDWLKFTKKKERMWV